SGTERVADVLGRRLDDGYHYFRHVAPAGAEPIDAVVVGPGGTWALSLASVHGRFRKRNGHWYRWNRSTESWVPWDAQPVTAARLVGHRLDLFLERATLPGKVEACLVAPADTQIDWEPDQRPGIHVHSGVERLSSRIGRDEALTEAQVERIVALLDPRQPLPRLVTSSPRG
ncbi:MAG: hypothetical protein ACRDGH_14085, partial [Candidatus Limnocylindria bacterium]